MAIITELAHSAYRCKDIDASLAFYKLLGIHESFRLFRDDGSLMLIYLHVVGDRFIELFPGGVAQDPAQKPSYMHLCLATDNIRQMVETVRAAGVKVDTEVKLGLDGNEQAWIKDPDGNPLELMQLSDESPQRRIARGLSAINPATQGDRAKRFA